MTAAQLLVQIPCSILAFEPSGGGFTYPKTTVFAIRYADLIGNRFNGISSRGHKMVRYVFRHIILQPPSAFGLYTYEYLPSLIMLASISTEIENRSPTQFSLSSLNSPTFQTLPRPPRRGFASITSCQLVR